MYAVMAPSPEATLDAFLCNSARALLGLPPWKTGMAACWELGWCLGGFARGILEVTCRRAKLWALPDDDFYKLFFMQGHHVPGSWPARSLALLQAWGLDDWPDCEGDLTLARYKTSIRAILAHVCCANGATSLTDGSAVPYFSIFPGLVPRDSLQLAARQSLSPAALVGCRALARFRLGALKLTHRGGLPTQAKASTCMFCERLTSSPLAHCLLYCQAWDEPRATLMGSHAWGDDADGRFHRLITMDPSDPGFPTLATFLHEVDMSVVRFWRGGRRLHVVLP